jgi:hypothetical protein
MEKDRLYQANRLRERQSDKIERMPKILPPKTLITRSGSQPVYDQWNKPSKLYPDDIPFPTSLLKALEDATAVSAR